MTDMDELVLWLREQIAETRVLAELVRDTWAVESIYEKIRSAVKQVANRESVLAQCDAQERLLDFLLGMNDEAEGIALVVPFLGEKYRERFEHGVKLLALSYQHRPGYRSGWRPAGGISTEEETG